MRLFQISLENKSCSCQRKVWLGESLEPRMPAYANDCHLHLFKRKALAEDCPATPRGLRLGHVILFSFLIPSNLSFSPVICFLCGPFKVVIICTELQNMSRSPQTTLATVYCNKITSYICRNSFGVILFFPPNIYIIGQMLVKRKNGKQKKKKNKPKIKILGHQAL